MHHFFLESIGQVFLINNYRLEYHRILLLSTWNNNNCVSFLKETNPNKPPNLSPASRGTQAEQVVVEAVAAQGSLLRGIDIKTVMRKGISFFYLCSLFSKKLFIRKQNGSQLQYTYNFFHKKILNGNHMANTFSNTPELLSIPP